MCCCCDACACPCLSSLRDAGVEGSRTLLAITALHVRDLVSCEHGAAHLNGRQRAFVVKQGPWLLCTHGSGTSMSAACPEMTGGLKS